METVKTIFFLIVINIVLRYLLQDIGVSEWVNGYFCGGLTLSFIYLELWKQTKK